MIGATTERILTFDLQFQLERRLRPPWPREPIVFKSFRPTARKRLAMITDGSFTDGSYMLGKARKASGYSTLDPRYAAEIGARVVHAP